MPRSYTVEAIVLKRYNFSDADRFVTLFSREQGKLTGLAKGVRRLTSKKRPALEPGNHVKAAFSQGRSTDLITQADLITSFPDLRQTLVKTTQLCQVLEIIDSLTAEAEAHPTVFTNLINLLYQLHLGGPQKTHILSATKHILIDLGFGIPDDPSEAALKDHLHDITGHPLRSKTFFSAV